MREILTPRTPRLHGDRVRDEQLDGSQHGSHPVTPITPRRFGSRPVSVVYHPQVKRLPDLRSSLSLSSGSWPELSSLEQENLHRQLQNHLQQQQQRRFSDIGMSPITPRSGSTDLPPYNSARPASNTPKTPRALASIQEHLGSSFSLDELRNFKLHERSLPLPSPPMPRSAHPLQNSGSFREEKAVYGAPVTGVHGGFGSGAAYDNLASLTASGPGMRRENGVHVPYLDIPMTSRSSTMKTQELLSALLSGYQTSSTNASSTLFSSQSKEVYPEGALGARGSLSLGVPEPDSPASASKGGGAKAEAGAESGEGWTRRDKMLLVGLICVALIVILLAVIVLLVAVGVVRGDSDSSSSSSSSLLSGQVGSHMFGQDWSKKSLLRVFFMS